MRRQGGERVSPEEASSLQTTRDEREMQMATPPLVLRPETPTWHRTAHPPGREEVTAETKMKHRRDTDLPAVGYGTSDVEEWSR